MRIHARHGMDLYIRGVTANGPMLLYEATLLIVVWWWCIPEVSASVVGPLGVRTGTTFSFACAADELLGLVATKHYTRFQSLSMACQNELTGAVGASAIMTGSGYSSSFTFNMYTFKGAVAMSGAYDKDSMCGVQFQFSAQAAMPAITSPTDTCTSAATGGSNTLRCPAGEKISGLWGTWQGADAIYRIGIFCRPAQCRGVEVDSTFCSCLQSGTYQSATATCSECTTRLSACNPAYQYLAGCGGTSAGTCTSCNALPAGYGFTGVIGQASDCPSVKCPSGMASPGGTSTAICYPCPANSNPAADGSVCNCVAGYYKSGGACVACPAGTWGAAAGQTTCPNVCPSGTWGTAVAQTTQAGACSGGCTAGYYSTTTGATSYATACNLLRCAVDNYWDGAKCVSCLAYATANCAYGAGLYLAGCGVASPGICTKCNANYAGVKFRGEVGLAADCAGWFCMPGTYVPAGGFATNCYNCPASAWSATAASVCYCGAGSYSVAGSCTTTPCAGTCPTAPCPLGGASSGVCQGCPLGTYGTVEGRTSQAAACTGACSAGTYGITVGGTSASAACAACLSLENTRCLVAQYLSGCGGANSGTCQPCTNGAVGRIMTGRGGLTGVCPLLTCQPGTYSLGGATTTCLACSANMQSANDFGSCQCVPGTYNVAGACRPCPAGRWGVVSAAADLDTGCGSRCAAGKYGTATGATSDATACTSACPPGRWGSNTGATSLADGCFGLSPVGTWSSVSGATSSDACGNNRCPAGTYGAAEGATTLAAGCNGTCPAGTFGTIKGSSTLVQACGERCSFGTYGTVTGKTSQSLACPGVCPGGTYAIAGGQTSAALACSMCATCFPGATTVEPCTNSSQIKCGAYVADGYSNPSALGGLSNPVYYVRGLAASPFLGVVPVAYTIVVTPSFPTFVPPTYNTNLQGVSTRVLPDMPYPMVVRTLVTCPPPTTGRVFRPWSPAPLSISCPSNPLACLSVSVVCDVAASTQCVGGFAGGGGYFTGADGTSCVACTTSASQPPCGWGEYGNVSACSRTSDSKCAPCYGAKPANAIWTKSRPPHYFAGAPDCEWACDVGFYLDGGQCVACVLPANGAFRGGDVIGGGEVVLTTTPIRVSRYLGGSLAAGCGVVCSAGTQLVYPSIGAGQTFDSANVRCNPCFVPACGLGQDTAFADGQSCLVCLDCAPVANARFLVAGGCSFACNAGFFRFGGACQSCSSAACPAGQYRAQCTETSDSVCTLCAAACAAGTYTVSACSPVSNRVCAPCAADPVANGVLGPECAVSCIAGFVYNGSACLECARGCAADQEPVVPCDAQTLGCRPCPVPTGNTGPWCWTGNPYIPCQTKAFSDTDRATCRKLPSQFVPTVLAATTAFVTTARVTVTSSASFGNDRSSSRPIAVAPTSPIGSSPSPTIPQADIMGVLTLLSCEVAVFSSAPPWCRVPQWNASVRAVFGPDALILGLVNQSDVLDCPDFVCPPCVRPDLPQADNSSTWRLVFQWYQPSSVVDLAPYFANLTALDPSILGSTSFLVLGQKTVSRAAARVWVAIQNWVADSAPSSVAAVAAVVGALSAVALIAAIAWHV